MPAISLREVLNDPEVPDSALTMALRYQQQAEKEQSATLAAKHAKTEAERKAAEARAREGRAAQLQQTAEAQARAAARTTKAHNAAPKTSTTQPKKAFEARSTGAESAKPVVAPNRSTAERVVAFMQASAARGDSYVMGASGPYAWDCSGLVRGAYASVGISLPRVAAAQSTVGTQVSLNNLRPGDILYWGSAGNAYHVAVYVGNGEFVGAQNPKTGVAKQSMKWSPPTGAVRVL
ncbi:C40 family peptidase [Streptomyces vinaceus]|uniref:C40 family peptidase n=1 Tax=Streptomyces vinaceus TaxID=1960 RepID=UPI003800CCEE